MSDSWSSGAAVAAVGTGTVTVVAGHEMAKQPEAALATPPSSSLLSALDALGHFLETRSSTRAGRGGWLGALAGIARVHASPDASRIVGVYKAHVCFALYLRFELV